MRPNVSLAFLPIESIVAEPIDYLVRQGVRVACYAYRALSDFGLGAPVIRYQVDCDSGAQTFIAKWHEPAEGACTFALLRALWDAGFADERYHICEAWAYVAEHDILLQRQASGIPLIQYLDDAPRAEVPVHMAARWLAKLHALRALPIACDKFGVLSVSSLIAAANLHRDALAAAQPAFAPRVAAIVSALAARLEADDAPCATPTHGDYHPKNIYVAGERLTVIDFDRFAFSHAERDVAYFLVQSMTMAYTPSHGFARTRARNAAFRDEYARCAPPLCAARLGAYAALAFVEILYYRLCVRPVADAAFVAAWLDACVRALDDPLG